MLRNSSGHIVPFPGKTRFFVRKRGNKTTNPPVDESLEKWFKGERIVARRQQVLLLSTPFSHIASCCASASDDCSGNVNVCSCSLAGSKNGRVSENFSTR